jgi:hypothetical protein
VAGVRGDDLAGAKRSKRSAASAAPASSASGLRSRAARRKQSPRTPGTGRAAVPDCRHGRPDSAVQCCDEGEALIAALASEPARRPATPEAAVRRHHARPPRGWWRRARWRDCGRSRRERQLDAKRRDVTSDHEICSLTRIARGFSSGSKPRTYHGGLLGSAMRFSEISSRARPRNGSTI